MGREKEEKKVPKSYREAGVNHELSSLAVGRIIKALEEHGGYAKANHRITEAFLRKMHFSGLIKLSGKNYLAITTDGVGTKIIVAKMLGKYDTIGIDLVAMNVNDLICTGAKPLAMVDYIAVEKPDPEREEQIAKGIAEGAKIADISIVGGELAVMPEIINGIDLSGTAIGMVRENKIITGEEVKHGDAVFALESSGIHCNGLTLARKVLLGYYSIEDKIFGNRTVGEALLEPTKIYVREVLEIIKKCNVKALANITGGGLGNLYRVCKHGIEINSLPEEPEIFKVIKELGKISDEEMYKTFNMGIGFCIIASESEEDKIRKICERHKTKVFKIGAVKKGKRGIKIKKDGKTIELRY